MRISLTALLSAGALLPAPSHCLAETTITLSVPASQLLPNPAALPPSTHATLTTLGQTYAAPLSAANTFVFRNVTRGSYLADVHCASWGFAPLRVDVLEAGEDVPSAAAVVGEPVGPGAAAAVVVRAWETYRGNEWDNRGEEAVRLGGDGFAVKCLGKKVFFQERSKFSILTILKNPMILLGLVSLGIFIGMPKLVENMDPEMRAEWEEQQKSNPMSSIMGGGKPGASPMGNFDMAAFMAGSDKKSTGEESSGNGGKKGGKK
ncbi:hypothetical protein BKA67DRAFT_162715 [Truncatella angustata]|uniref:ER membrane protein complex subunit 7 beta-sandwich domain-containing protein n=1 Tax=Truncatella angustata TaxID=152316 RepID=A0A9P8ZZW9_9PEZI|nr:uncharacterized protein BKA67DRAFT_162715 [Truncatella angustata]KAH6656658.1 hypothetical protein BKA67DRAFT_162715 [Truncatella angustata]KAH8199280.1 hypothetical protein TruAng_006563 [Truncatella angustata]